MKKSNLPNVLFVALGTIIANVVSLLVFGKNFGVTDTCTDFGFPLVWGKGGKCGKCLGWTICEHSGVSENITIGYLIFDLFFWFVIVYAIFYVLKKYKK